MFHSFLAYQPPLAREAPSQQPSLSYIYLPHCVYCMSLCVYISAAGTSQQTYSVLSRTHFSPLGDE